MRSADTLATELALIVKEAVSPLLERLSVTEARLVAAQAAVPDLQREIATLRERLAIAETKSAVVLPDPPEPVDLAPFTERQSATDARLATALTTVADLQRDVVSLRERLAIAETKGVQEIPEIPPPADLSPLFERLAITETKLATLASLEAGFNSLRERLTVAETKADRPLDLPPPVDLGPLLERLAVAETKAAAAAGLDSDVAALRQALAVTSARTPEPPVDLTPLCERLASAEARLDTLGDLRDRVVVVETKAAAPIAPVAPLLTKAEPDHDLRDRVLTLERKHELVDANLVPIRERIVALETRAPVPGPPGLNGKDGKDGVNGKDGFGFDDLSVGFDGDRTIQLSFVRESQRKDFPIVLPYLRHQGVFTEGKAYETGDVVTWGGSMWHANEPTSTKPGDGSKSWTLVVKRGRDGKDGRDAAALPIVGLK